MHLFSHTYGCSQLGDDHINTRTMLQNMVRHPNAGAVLVIGLGCENNQVDAFRETLGEYDPSRVHFMICQHQDDEVEAGIEHLYELYEAMRHDKREPGKLGELKFGLECGGSDGLSGITANPMLGRFSDYIIGNGGTTVLTEVPGNVRCRTDSDEPLPRRRDLREDGHHGERLQTVFYRA